MMMFSRILRNCKSFDTSGWWPTMPIIIMKQKNDDSTLPLFSTHPPRPVNDKDLLNFNFSWFLTFGQADQSKAFPIVIIKMENGKVIAAHRPGTGANWSLWTWNTGTDTMVLVQWYWSWTWYWRTSSGKNSSLLPPVWENRFFERREVYFGAGRAGKGADLSSIIIIIIIIILVIIIIINHHHHHHRCFLYHHHRCCHYRHHHHNHHHILVAVHCLQTNELKEAILEFWYCQNQKLK